jgi:hypothetical protein
MCDPILPQTKNRGETFSAKSQIFPTKKKVREMPPRHFTSFFLLRTLGAGVTPAAHREGD